MAYLHADANTLASKVFVEDTGFSTLRIRFRPRLESLVGDYTGVDL